MLQGYPNWSESYNVRKDTFCRPRIVFFPAAIDFAHTLAILSCDRLQNQPCSAVKNVAFPLANQRSPRGDSAQYGYVSRKKELNSPFSGNGAERKSLFSTRSSSSSIFLSIDWSAPVRQRPFFNHSNGDEPLTQITTPIQCALTSIDTVTGTRPIWRETRSNAGSASASAATAVLSTTPRKFPRKIDRSRSRWIIKKQ